MSTKIKVEFTIEPFVDGAVPAYVQAAVDALRGMGLDPDVGPFGTSFEIGPDRIGQAVSVIMDRAYSNGATYVSIDSGPVE